MRTIIIYINTATITIIITTIIRTNANTIAIIRITTSASTKTINDMGIMAAKNVILGLKGEEMLSCVNSIK